MGRYTRIGGFGGEPLSYCLDHESKPVRIKTVAGLLGLLALEPGDPQVEALVRHLTDEREFGACLQPDRLAAPGVADYH